LEIHPTEGRFLPLGNTSHLFNHWQIKSNAEQMNYWLFVLLENHSFWARIINDILKSSTGTASAASSTFATLGYSYSVLKGDLALRLRDIVREEVTHPDQDNCALNAQVFILDRIYWRVKNEDLTLVFSQPQHLPYLLNRRLRYVVLTFPETWPCMLFLFGS
jgi:hypothetical protein